MHQGFSCINFEGFCQRSSCFLGTSSNKNEEKNSGGTIHGRTESDQALTVIQLKSILIQLSLLSRHFCKSTHFCRLYKVNAPPIFVAYASHLYGEDGGSLHSGCFWTRQIYESTLVLRTGSRIAHFRFGSREKGPPDCCRPALLTRNHDPSFCPRLMTIMGLQSVFPALFGKAVECQAIVCSSKRPPKSEPRSVRPHEVFEDLEFRLEPGKTNKQENT